MSSIELTGSDGAPRVMRWPAEASEDDLPRMSRRYLVAALLEARRRQSHPYIVALEEIARALAEHPGALHSCTGSRFCPYCGKRAWPNEAITHTDECLVTKAGRLLAW